MTEYSRQQLTRLIKQYTKTGKVHWAPCRSNGFAKKYTDKDITLLAKTDELHDTPCGPVVLWSCGPAVKKLCERADDVFDDENYRRVAKLLQKLFIEFTKSRSRHSIDNALAESKNTSVVRKVFDYTRIPQQWAPEINKFNRS